MIMERNVGEEFDFRGIKLQVQDTGQKIFCDGCYFNKSEHECLDAYDIGFCLGASRIDGRNVVFVEVRDKN